MSLSDSTANHPTDATFHAYLKNRLDDGDDGAVRAHLAACDDCRRRLEGLQDDRSGPRPAPPPWIARRLRGLVGGRPVTGGWAPAIDGYAIEAVLGRGGMGVVYRAHHDDFGVVALKTIRSDGPVDADRLDRFRREMDQARAMSDHVDDQGRRIAAVRVFEVDECRGTLYISMEWAVGGTVRDRLDELVEQPEESARLLVPIAEALHELHRQGRIHRDVKPANVLLQLRPGVVEDPAEPISLTSLDAILGDFGLARESSSSGPASTEAHDLPGTLPYVAPELVKDGRLASPRADIYSLGATLYEMLCGAPPFGDRGISRKALLDRISDGHPSHPSSRLDTVPRALETIALKCLEKDPSRRYASAQEVADDLRRFLNHEPIQARPPGVLRRAGRWADKHKGRVAASVVALTAFLAAIGLAWGARQERELYLFRAQTLQRQAHDELVDSARAAARAGQWSNALPRYRSAIDDGRDDAVALRVERLHGLLAENDTASLDTELADLDSRDDLGPLTAQVKLIQGAHALCDLRRIDEGRRRVREALEHRSDLNVFRGDGAFAEALIETRPRVAIEHLKRALDLDPRHRLAHASLTVALAAAGRIAEARTHCDELRKLFPNDEQAAFLEALIDAIDRDRNRASIVDRAADRDGSTDRAYLTPLTEALTLFENFQAIAPPRPEDSARIDQAIGRLKLASADASAFPVPTVSLFDGWIGRMLEARHWNEPTDENHQKLLDLAEENPEALLLAMATANRFHRFVMSFLQGDHAAARAFALEAGRLGRDAADAPTVIPRSPIRYQARIVGAIADLSVLKLTPDPDPIHWARLREQFPRLVNDGDRWPAIRDQGLGMLVELVAAPLTPDQAQDWQIDRPEGRAGFMDRRRQVLRYANALTDSWIEAADGSPASIHARRTLEDRGSGDGLQPASE